MILTRLVIKTERSRWGFGVLTPHLIYILRTISTTILGIAVKNNSNDSARSKKYYCGNKEASLWDKELEVQ